MKAMPLKQGEAQLYAVAQRGQNRAVKLYTWKQDRSVEVEWRDGVITLREQGFVNEQTEYAAARALKHPLKVACAREFPRSNKVKVSER